MKTCLTVIDAQESFRHRPYATDRDMAPYPAAQNALIDGCAAAEVPIVRVFHVDGPATAANPFAVGSGHIRPIRGLADLDATLTFDLVQPDGRPLPAADIQARTATVLQDRFAHVCSAADALQRIGQRQAA